MNILKDLTQTKAELLAAITAIDEQKFNTVPFEGSWTAAQVSEHLQEAIGADVLYAETKSADRQADEKVNAISDVFLNFEVKYQSPDFIIPANHPHSKSAMLAILDSAFNKLIAVADTLDLSEICLEFEIPGFGTFTRLEFLWFFNVHTIRHTRQLKNIAVALAKV